MAQLLVIVVLDLPEILYLVWMVLIPIFLLFLTKFYLNSIDLSGHSGLCLLPLILIIVAVLPHLIFAGFFEVLKLVLRSSRLLRSGF